MGKTAKSPPAEGLIPPQSDSEILNHNLADLDLDGSNPRLGNKAATFTSQDQILD
jgi:hypothetical protein